MICFEVLVIILFLRIQILLAEILLSDFLVFPDLRICFEIREMGELGVQVLSSILVISFDKMQEIIELIQI
jgi:hypothetical protein